MLGRFFRKKRPGIKPLSDFLKHVSYGNSQYFCALAACAPLAHSARRGGEAGFRVFLQGFLVIEIGIYRGIYRGFIGANREKADARVT